MTRDMMLRRVERLGKLAKGRVPEVGPMRMVWILAVLRLRALYRTLRDEENMDGEPMAPVIRAAAGDLYWPANLGLALRNLADDVEETEAELALNRRLRLRVERSRDYRDETWEEREGRLDMEAEADMEYRAELAFRGMDR